MLPMVGDMQAVMQDPAAEADIPFTGSVGDIVLTVVTSVITGLVTMIASSLVTVALTRVALGEAVGAPVPTSEMWATMRRRGLPALGTSLLIGLLSMLLFAVPFLLGLAPILVVREPGWLTIGPILLGTVLGLLAMLWLWARTVLAIPALVIEDTTVLGALRRSFALTRGRRLWRVLGIALLLYLAYMLVVQVISGVTGTIAGIAYFAILLVSGFEAVLAGMAVLTILSMLGSFLATFLLAPFLSAGFTTLYADVRMREEAWDVELTRTAREAWAADGVR
jgi:MFS family permease